MQKTILITGATDGIGLSAARLLIAKGHYVLLHGRNADKLAKTKQALVTDDVILANDANVADRVETYVADLSQIEQVADLAGRVKSTHDRLDVLINNAGVFSAPDNRTSDGLDIRFVVNTIAPYFLTQQLVPLLVDEGRVINLSSAAQSPVDIDALIGRRVLEDFSAYAQSKLAIAMWSRSLAQKHANLLVIAVNPGSMLGSKMVRENFGVEGGDVAIGAKILQRLALDDEFKNQSGEYFDNDIGRFSAPHQDVLNAGKTKEVINAIEQVLANL